MNVCQARVVLRTQWYLLRLLHLLQTCLGKWILLVRFDSKGRALLDRWVSVAQRPGVAEGSLLDIRLLVIEFEGLQKGEAAQKRLIVSTVRSLVLHPVLQLLVGHHLLEAPLAVQLLGGHLSTIQFVLVKTRFDAKSFR